MPSLTLALAALAGTSLALPNRRAPTDDPIRTLPTWWGFNITSLDGPACTDLGTDGYTTRPTYGSNTVDGSEIYYWHFAYPGMHASVDAETPEASTWCETTISYAELSEDGSVKEDPGYRLRPHKNGTEMLARYELDEGVRVTWTFTYYPEDAKEIVDTIVVDGPRQTEFTDTDSSPVDKVVQWALPKCGAGTIKYRTELKIEALEKGAEGTAASEQHKTDDGGFDYLVHSDSKMNTCPRYTGDTIVWFDDDSLRT